MPGTRNKLAILALTTVFAASLPCHATERVTLLNGFAMLCHHHSQDGEKTRLYLSPGEENFIEMKTEQIGSVETVPESALPPPVLGVERSSGPEKSSALETKDLHTGPDLSQDDLQEMIRDAGQEHNLDVDLLASVIKTESGGNSRAVSHAGAKGLMQLMPSTAAAMGVQDSFAPDQNVRGGTAYLDSLLVHYHDNLALALAAYNAGPKAVDRYHGIPPYPETRAYVARVIHEFNRRTRAHTAVTKASPKQSIHTTASSR